MSIQDLTKFLFVGFQIALQVFSFGHCEVEFQAIIGIVVQFVVRLVIFHVCCTYSNEFAQIQRFIVWSSYVYHFIVSRVVQADRVVIVYIELAFCIGLCLIGKRVVLSLSEVCS